MRLNLVLKITLTIALAISSAAASDDLPAWKDGKAKQGIVQFVEEVSTKKGPKIVPTSGRIAVFGNDGTLWSEQPMNFQLTFDIDRLKALAPQDPGWKDKEASKSVLAGDLAGVADRYGLSAIVFYKTSFGWQPFGIERLGTFGSTGYFRADSNINFYPSEILATATGLMINF